MERRGRQRNGAARRLRPDGGHVVDVVGDDQGRREASAAARTSRLSGVASRRRIEPRMRFSRTRLTDIVHRLTYAVVGFTVPVRRYTPILVHHPWLKRVTQRVRR